MKFAWTEKDKERFFKRAERQLKAAGIDFVQVDREQIGVCTDHFKKGGSKPIYMHSRLIYTSYREEKKQ